MKSSDAAYVISEVSKRIVDVSHNSQVRDSATEHVKPWG